MEKSPTIHVSIPGSSSDSSTSSGTGSKMNIPHEPARGDLVSPLPIQSEPKAGESAPGRKVPKAKPAAKRKANNASRKKIVRPEPKPSRRRRGNRREPSKYRESPIAAAEGLLAGGGTVALSTVPAPTVAPRPGVVWT